MVRTQFLSIAAAVLAASTAGADFTGLASISYVAATDDETYHIVEVYAVFDDPTDRLLNVFNVNASLSAGSVSNWKATFHQASVEGGIPPSFVPLPFLPPGPAWTFDTFVTIGAEQGDLANGTVLDPDFVDSNFTSASAISGTAGWYNMPPTNGYGLAGADLRVKLGQFTVTGAQYEPGLTLGFSMTVGYSNGGVVDFGAASRQFPYPSGDMVPYIPDRLDGDGISDIVFVNEQSRKVAAWLMEGLTRKQGMVLPDQVPAGYACEGIGDLDGNGSTDIVWRDAANSRLVAWLTAGLEVFQKSAIAGTVGSNMQVVGIGDLSGDGRGDIVLRNTTNGDVTAWLMDGVLKAAEGTLGNSSGLTPEGLGDFDGDGRHDILWRTAGGTMRGWLVQGLDLHANEPIANVAAPVSGAWLVAGIADLTGDGKDDIVWRQQATGLVAGWQMDGLTRADGKVINQGISSVWRIDALRDLDGDGMYDLVWRHALNGDLNAWKMNGLQRATGSFVRNAQPSWIVAVP
ncbi:MAG: FG-GAP repeat domain-containing protein [Planctomycetota bacterium]